MGLYASKLIEVQAIASKKLTSNKTYGIYSCISQTRVYDDPHFQGQKSDFSTFLDKKIKFRQIGISQKDNSECIENMENYGSMVQLFCYGLIGTVNDRFFNQQGCS